MNVASSVHVHRRHPCVVYGGPRQRNPGDTLRPASRNASLRHLPGAFVRLNSFDDWSPLREVVLGVADNYVSHERELSFELFFHENIVNDNPSRSEWYYPRLASGADSCVSVKQRYVDELVEDLDGMAKVLESLSVNVLRPTRLAADTNEVRTLAWSASVVPPLNVRDNTLVLGDEIIETPPMIRSRYFETHLLKPIFQDYFARGARWTAMPRPLRTDAP